MLKKLIIIFSVLFGVFVIVVATGFIFLMRGQKDVLNEDINGISLDNKADDTYVGEYEGYRWSNKVEIVVENKKIVEIKIIDDQKFPRDEVSSKLFDEIIEKQSLDVDGVSGATVSNNAYLKAIEDALK